MSKVYSFITIIILLIPSIALSQIVLTDEKIPLKPTEYYISGVSDDRAEKGPVAKIIIKNQDNTTTAKAVDLQNGVEGSIGQFIRRNLPGDRNLRSVNISIKELKVSESNRTVGSVDGQIKLKLSFGLKKEWGVEHLFDCGFALKYDRPVDDIRHVEFHVRSVLKTGIHYFDDWMKENVNTDTRLARAVKISFTDYQEAFEGDTIYYSSERPLTWNDFQSQNKHLGKYLAVVMPSIGYNQEAKLVNGVINVKIAMKAYVPKSACWAASTGRSDYALNHEQRHFDIVKIIAEQFKQKVLAEKLTPDTYEAFINMQYLDSFRDMDKMQRAYDQETSHGLNSIRQTAWNELIDKELRESLRLKVES